MRPRTSGMGVTMKVLLAVLGLLWLAAAPVRAEDAKSFPARTIEIVVGTTPGGPNDAIARILSEELKTAWNASVAVLNKPGAGNTTGTIFVANSSPDGYTLLVTGVDALTASPAIYPHLRYDPVRSFAPVSLLASGTMVLVVRRDLPVGTLAEFVALPRRQGKSLTFASGGVGTLSHLTIGLFQQKTGMDAMHVPYKGAAPALTDLLGGHVAASWLTRAPARPDLVSGQRTALAVATEKRSPSLPDVPTVTEAGIADFEATTAVSLLAPAGTPPAVIDKLARASEDIFRRPEVRKALAEIGFEASGAGPEALAAQIGKGMAKWPDVVKKAGIGQ